MFLIVFSPTSQKHHFFKLSIDFFKLFLCRMLIVFDLIEDFHELIIHFLRGKMRTLTSLDSMCLKKLLALSLTDRIYSDLIVGVDSV